jgi:hypothetical protein
MPSEIRQVPAVGVDRLQPGDHAFLAFSSDEERWDILGVFTQQGMARDEKVLLLVDVAHSPAEVAARVAGGAAAARRAIGRGQLVVSNTPRFGPGDFDAVRLVDAIMRAADDACCDGHHGLRGATEMSLALTPLDTLDQAVEYETVLHESLFTVRKNRRYTSLCHWDEREFGGSPVMDAVRAIHPVTVLDQGGTLHVALTSAGVRLTGDSDLSTRADFDAALRELASQSRETLVLDIADLSFLDAGSAGAVLRFAADLVPPRRLEVRCRNHHRRMLHVLGARTIRQLSIVTARL